MAPAAFVVGTSAGRPAGSAGYRFEQRDGTGGGGPRGEAARDHQSRPLRLARAAARCDRRRDRTTSREIGAEAGRGGMTCRTTGPGPAWAQEAGGGLAPAGRRARRGRSGRMAGQPYPDHDHRQGRTSRAGPPAGGGRARGTRCRCRPAGARAGAATPGGSPECGSRRAACRRAAPRPRGRGRRDAGRALRSGPAGVRVVCCRAPRGRAAPGWAGASRARRPRAMFLLAGTAPTHGRTPGPGTRRNRNGAAWRQITMKPRSLPARDRQGSGEAGWRRVP